MYSINFAAIKKKFCLSLHYNGANSYLFVNGTEIIKFKAKDSEIITNPLCLGTISESFPLANMITRLHGSTFYFSVDYRIIAIDDILDIHKNLEKKNGIKYKMFGFIKKVFLVAMAFFSFNPLNLILCKFFEMCFSK